MIDGSFRFDEFDFSILRRTGNKFEIENRQIARCRSTRIIPTRRTGTGWRVELGGTVENYCGIKSRTAVNDRPDELARQVRYYFVEH